VLRQPTLVQMRATAALLRIPLKDGAVDTWTLNGSQERVAESLCAGRSIIVLKLRQEGITSVCLLWLLLLAVMNDGQRFLIVLQGDEEAKEQLEIVKGWLSQLGLGLLEVSQAHKVTLPNGASIHAKTSHGGEAEGSETKKGRSGAYAAALLSEAAYYRNDKALGAIKASVGRGPIVIESTASGPEGFYAGLWHTDRSSFERVFIGIESSERCRDDPAAIADEEWMRLQAEHGFTSRPHAAWWARELRDVGGDVLSMLREYPVRPEDPFRVAEGLWVQTRPGTIYPVDATASGVLLYEPPREGARYIITVDVAEGVGGDWSALWVIERGTQDIAAAWASNTEETDVLAARIREVQLRFKPDVVIIEKNGVGVAAVKESRRLGVPVLERVASEADKYAVLVAAKRYVESRALVPELLLLEAQSLRAKVGRLGRYQWIGRKDGLIALGQGLEWMRLNPWAPSRPVSEEEVYRQRALSDVAADAYYS